MRSRGTSNAVVVIAVEFVEPMALDEYKWGTLSKSRVDKRVFLSSE